MSRGLGKNQRAILGVLNGTEPGRVYRNTAGGLDTAEVLRELLERRLVSGGAPRKQQMATVFRSCASLCRRGLIHGRYTPDVNNPGRTTVRWQAADRGKA